MTMSNEQLKFKVEERNQRILKKVIYDPIADNPELCGKRFGNLTAIKYVGVDKGRHKYWLFKCDCGNEPIAELSNVKSGRTISCGCIQNKRTIESHTTHGLTHTKIYGRYKAMVARCYRPSTKSYVNYGGRGIKICDEWLDKKDGFVNFYNWAIENGYSEELSLDRIDVDGNYEPSNCRWVSQKIQSNNIRNTIYATYRGYTFPIGIWAEITKIPREMIDRRIRHGWSITQVLRVPPYDDRWSDNYLVWEVPPEMLQYNRPDKEETSYK